MLLMIDNYDSFTYNLVQYFGELDEDVKVFRNDAITLKEIAAMNPARIVVSPGPCSPAQAGISVAAIREFAGRIPLLGVCLGHQSIGAAFGGEIDRVVAYHLHRLAQLAEILHQVVGERVVIVDHEQHDQSSSLLSRPAAAISAARRTARALFSVSCHSEAGSESATMPAPACMCRTPSLIRAVRSAIARSMSP